MAVALSQSRGTLQSSRRLRIELAGPAGVGKSTLSATLARRLQAATGTIWGLPVVPLLMNGARLAPTFSRLWLDSRSPLWDETRHMVRLSTLQQILRHPTPQDGRALIFDEGPVFALSWLRGFGHETLRQSSSAAWWRTALSDWAKAIDVVIVLDAPDPVLASRIRSRPYRHEVTDFPEDEIARWMARFRRSLDWVLAGMAAHGGPSVVRLSSHAGPAEHVAERMVQELSGRSYGR
jgi:AAA domain